MKSTIKETTPCRKREDFPQLFRGKKTGNVYLYCKRDQSTIVHIGEGNGLNNSCLWVLGEVVSSTSNPYSSPILEVFEGTVELHNP